jgi:hypothetical protein
MRVVSPDCGVIRRQIIWRAALVLFIAALSVCPALAEDDLPSWCPVDQAPVLEEITLPYLRHYSDRVLVAWRDEDGNAVNDSRYVPGLLDPLLNTDGTRYTFHREVLPYNYEIITRPSVRSGRENRLVTPADFAEMRSETNAIGYDPQQMAWIPFTDSLVFSIRVYRRPESLYNHIADDLWLVDADTGAVVNLLPEGEGGDFFVSPDGRYIAVANYDGLQIVDLETHNTAAVDLPSYHAEILGWSMYYPVIRWLADSSGLLVATSNSEVDSLSQHAGLMEVWQVPVDGSAPHLIGTHPAFFLSFEFSPDLALVAYWRTDEHMSNRRTLVIASTDGTETIEIVTQDSVSFEYWLLDSRHFAYRLQTGPGESVLLIGDVCSHYQAEAS